MKIDDPFEMVAAFHEQFDNRKPNQPTAFSADEAAFRAEFKIEELVEFVYGACNNDVSLFKEKVNQLQQAIKKAETKIFSKEKRITDPLVDEVDALTDLLYFTYGSFCLLGVDPTEIFVAVHHANMGKLFPDGKPHYDEITNKVLKPANWEAEWAPEPKIKELLERQKNDSVEIIS